MPKMFRFWGWGFNRWCIGFPCES